MQGCNYYLNNGLSNFSMTNLSTSLNDWTATNTTMSQGSHKAIFYCFDINGNVNNTEDVSFVIDSSAPSVINNTPLNQTYTTNSITFNVTATDSGGMQGCNYSLNNGVANYSMTNLSTSPSDWTATNTTMSQGNLKVIFYCFDINGNVNNTEDVSFVIESDLLGLD